MKEQDEDSIFHYYLFVYFLEEGPISRNVNRLVYFFTTKTHHLKDEKRNNLK